MELSSKCYFWMQKSLKTTKNDQKLDDAPYWWSKSVISTIFMVKIDFLTFLAPEIGSEPDFSISKPKKIAEIRKNPSDAPYRW